MIELIEKVKMWAVNRGIGDEKKTLIEKWPQYEKVKEEVDEIAQALVHSNKDALIDAIGDTAVTLIVLSAQNGLSFEDCLNTAYNEIKDRKGKLVDGKFVKESDL